MMQIGMNPRLASDSANHLVIQMNDLQEIAEFEAYILKLSEQGITTAEQFLSLSISESRETLRLLLDITEEEMDSLVAISREHVEPEYLEKLETTEVKEYPLGCLDEKEEEINEKDQVRDS